MQKRILIILSMWMCMAMVSGRAGAQLFSIKGTIRDADTAVYLAKSSVKISPSTDTTKGRYVTADDKGKFTIADLKAGSYQLSISFTGYQPQVRKVTVTNASVDLGEMLLVKKDKTLGDVVITGKVPPARQKGDTTEFNAAAMKVNPDATTEDLLKKAPGITVENGQVTAQGEQVRRITIDGRQYFGDDATAALKNLPAEVIDKVQVFDRMSDQAQLTGFDDGSGFKAINIVTKANMRNGQFGRIYGGYGTDDRYAAGGSVNFFKNDTRFNVIGLFNNVNQQNFSGEDLLGVSGQANNQGRGGGGGGGRMGGGGGGRPGGGFGGGGGGFSVGQQPGIATTNAVGLNYSDAFFKRKLEISGSYFFNQSETEASSETNRQMFLPGDTSQFYNQKNNSTTNNYNHRITGRAEYKIDSNNTLIVAPSFSFQKNDFLNRLVGINSTASDAFINSTVNDRNSHSEGFNFRNELTYRHGFLKRGRSISLSLNNSLNDRDGETYLDAISGYIKTGVLAADTLRQFTDNTTKSNNFSANLAYTEPIGKKGQLQLNYNPQWTNNTADQKNLLYDKTDQAYDILDTVQTNIFDNKVRAQNAGVTYRIGDRESQFSVGVNYQRTQLLSDQSFPVVASLDKTFQNWLPNIQWRKQLSKQTNLRLNYRASVNPPSVNQLQNVYNISNPLFITAGNPQLDQSYTHFLTGRINVTNTAKGTSMFGGFFAQKVQEYVTNGTWIASSDSALEHNIILRKGSQLSKPVNLDGFYSVRSFFTYGLPIKHIKSNLNFNLGLNYTRTPGQINNVTNYSNNYSYTTGVNLASNISEFIDFNISYNGTFNNVINSINPSMNNKYYYHNAGVKVNVLTKSGWFLLNDLTNQVYSGLADGFNQDFWLWNVSAGKKFLKNRRGELKATVFDLLKQNQSIVRNVGDTYIEDVQTQVLQQYFMLTFTYTLKNFGSSAKGRGTK
ncbi:MAG TPA: outer membrane beta-barrel protein [Phnomibacter sp.]|nr:outer membrane beta-barrel protein [Phnomibacter sp.]